MPEPYHYPGILLELSQGMLHVLQAQDWLEKVGASAEVDDFTRRTQERGNLRLALSRCKNAFNALRIREEEVSTSLALEEKELNDKSAPEIAKVLADEAKQGTQPATPLPQADGDA